MCYLLYFYMLLLNTYLALAGWVNETFFVQVNRYPAAKVTINTSVYNFRYVNLAVSFPEIIVAII